MELPMIWIGIAFVTAFAASARGRNGLGWFVLGLLFSVFALLTVLVISRVPIVDPTAPTPRTHVKCPDCKEFVLKEARVCKHCGCRLIPQE